MSLKFGKYCIHSSNKNKVLSLECCNPDSRHLFLLDVMKLCIFSPSCCDKEVQCSFLERWVFNFFSAKVCAGEELIK